MTLILWVIYVIINYILMCPYSRLFCAGDEMFSDIYKMRLIGGVLYEVEGKVQVNHDATMIDSHTACA